MSGLFITLEGIDGCGKSTQLEMLVRVLIEQGFDPIYTREPGGTALGENMRPLLLANNGIGLDPVTEMLLLAAARSQHVVEVIRPGLDAGRIVLSDRYTDSTFAFQGYGRGVDLVSIDQLNRIATGGLTPDLTLLFDVDVEIARGRLDARPARPSTLAKLVEPAKNRFDNENLDFHSRVRRGYLDLAKAQPERIRVIDASGPPAALHAAVLELILPLVEPLEALG